MRPGGAGATLILALILALMPEVSLMAIRPRRSSLLLALSVPIFIADAGPRCGGSNRRPEPPPVDDTTGDTSSRGAPGVDEIVVVPG